MSKFEKDKAFKLKKDLVIPAGTIFENWSNRQKEGEYFEAVWGEQVHSDFAANFSIPYGYMKEILMLNPDFFEEE